MMSVALQQPAQQRPAGGLQFAILCVYMGRLPVAPIHASTFGLPRYDGLSIHEKVQNISLPRRFGKFMWRSSTARITAVKPAAQSTFRLRSQSMQASPAAPPQKFSETGKKVTSHAA